MSGSDKDSLDIEEQLRRISVLRAEIRQRRQETFFLPIQVFISTIVAGAALSGALFAGIKLLSAH